MERILAGFLRGRGEGRNLGREKGGRERECDRARVCEKVCGRKRKNVGGTGFTHGTGILYPQFI